MTMTVLVTYDVATTTNAGRRRLRRLARKCADHGQRVQNSVFECQLDQTQWTRLRHILLNEFDRDEDSLRFYFLGKNWRGRIEHHGTKPSIDLDGPLIC